MGRVTIPLAARFAEVHAYDISPSHLALAQQRAEAMGAETYGSTTAPVAYQPGLRAAISFIRAWFFSTTRRRSSAN